MMTRTEILQHYKNFFDLNEIGTGEDDMIYIDWAEALLEDTEVVNKNDLLPRVNNCKCKESEIHSNSAFTYERCKNCKTPL